MPRPLKQIDGEQVFRLAKLGCTMEEVGEYFGVDKATISRRFATEFELARSRCKTSIRRWQMKKGKAGCTAMLIHLGKTYLGQTDRLDIKSDGKSINYVERAANPRDARGGNAGGVAPQSAPPTMGAD